MGGDAPAGRQGTPVLKTLRIVLTPAGSAGDVNPFIALGRVLRDRGHEVVAVTSEPFREAIEAAGLRFVGVLDRARYEEALHDPDLWHPRRGLRAIFRLLRREDLDRAWAALEREYEPGHTVLVGHPLSFPSRVFEEVHGAAAVTLQLAPIAFRTLHHQPLLPQGVDLNRAPRVARRLFWWVADQLVVEPLARDTLHPFMRAHGLRPTRRLFESWVHSPQRVLGLFPEWFGPIQPDWPSQLRLVGFPLFDGAVRPELPAELAARLARSDKPVVVTPGSANRQAAALFEAAAVATRELGVPALFVTPWPDQLPQPLPDHILHVGRAPFRALFPEAALVVHHGGIGTTAQGLAAGVPQIVQGRSFDQPDNGARLERLGVGRNLSARPPKADALRKAMRELLETPGVGRATTRWAEAMRVDAGEPAMTRAAEWVERAATGPVSGTPSRGR